MQWPLAETICPEKLKKSCFYHKLPKGNDLYKDWLTKCTREDAVNCKSPVKYSDYFFPKGYEDGVKNSLLGLPQKRILNKSAIPSSNLPHGSNF